MRRIDAHQHFWMYDPIRDGWMPDDMPMIKRDFLPKDLEPVLKDNGFEGCITVQSEQAEIENEFQLENAKKNNFIKGIVGWIDLQAKNVKDRLSYYNQFDKIKGFRHILQGEAQRDLMLKTEFLKGIEALKEFDYMYDILIFPDQLKFVKEFVAHFPTQKFVIDHLAKPYIKSKKIDDWKKNIQQIAKHENV